MRWYHWLAAVTLGVAMFALGGCGFAVHDVGYAGAHPGYWKVSCGSDGATFSVQGSIAALMYGSNNSASVQCKGTVEISQGAADPSPVKMMPTITNPASMGLRPQPTPGVEQFGRQTP